MQQRGGAEAGGAGGGVAGSEAEGGPIRPAAAPTGAERHHASNKHRRRVWMGRP